MALLTRLEIVQKVLAAINEQEVSAIGETIESDMAASILDSVYDKLLHDYPWPHLYQIGTLEITATPHIMKLPAQVMSLDWVRYNKNDMVYMTPYDFKVMMDGRDTTLSNVDSYGAITDRDPKYYTLYDDEFVYFDAYTDGSLVSATSSCYYAKMPAEMVNDTDYPDCPERFVSVLGDGTIAEAYIQLKADANMAAYYRGEYREGVTGLKRWARRLNMKDSTHGNDYGRKFIS